jgi:uncharacterized protein YndB with AHSA1/START domain
MSTTTKKTTITVRSTINAPIESVWKYWTNTNHIIHWNNASSDWHTTRAENDLRVGGRFISRMEAKDGSTGFDFSGIYTRIVHQKLIEYLLDDDRKVHVSFVTDGNLTTVSENFEAEQENSIDLQQTGWQSILNNFKKYSETYGKPKSIQFEILIEADIEKVYTTLIGENSYSEWTSAFNPTSHFKGSWEKGSKIKFIGTDQNGKQGGMASRINENIPNKYISIEHLAVIQDDVEITNDAEAELWKGATENYTFCEENGKTKLTVEMQANHEIPKEFISYFNATWPKALSKLKSICEK